MADGEPLDAEQFYADYERRARQRHERRTAKRRRRPTEVHGTTLRESRAGRFLIGAVVALAVATVVGLVALWPPGDHRRSVAHAFGGPTQAATVVAMQTVDCQGPTRQACVRVIANVDGKRVPITIGPVGTVQKLEVGDAIRVSHVVLPPGAKPLSGEEQWAFSDIDRHGPLLWLAIIVALLAVVVIRLRGLLAVVGVGLSLLVITTFVVPAILEGRPPLLVAVVGALAVMFVTLLLTNGIGVQTLAAALGIAATLLVTGVAGVLASHAVHLNGLSNDVALYLQQQGRGLSLPGIVLAAMIVGALGVLTDTAVTQASAVMALRRANVQLSARRLYREAFVVGRDHLSATIHTLVLAYAGAALPLLLVMRSTGVGFGDAINVQDVAEPVVATLVGCLGLICAVPLTTGLAAFLAVRVPPAAVGDGHHHHH
jgi:uncharacterized membrane protein